MLTGRMVGELNEQMNAELYSAYLYVGMAAWFDAEGLSGMGAWMRAQAQEETFHAFKFYHYIDERGGRVQLSAIEEPPAEWDSPLAVFRHVAEHEANVTSLINGLVDSAEEEHDHATRAFLQWFVSEQIEEEASADEIVTRLERIGDSGNGLVMLDRELGQRTFTPPTQEEEVE